MVSRAQFDAETRTVVEGLDQIADDGQFLVRLDQFDRIGQQFRVDP
ncbi:hypothetical protein HQ32_02263 [Prauserella sp. Am3]|nr:hypothetical protein HQ32_02263 [Prauserella sp. Am3]